MPNLSAPLPKAATTVVTALLAVLSGIALVLASTVPARAATTYTPTGGPVVSFLGSNISFTNIWAGQTFTCTTVSASGSVVIPGTSRAYGTTAISLGTNATSGCSHPMCGTTTVTPSGTWSFAITGDKTGSVWPARISNVSIQMTCGTCTFTVVGRVTGKFDTATQRFTPASGASGLTVSGNPPPSGAMCVTLDILAGDEFAVGGSFTLVTPSGSSGLTISNP